jgi:hypothetical protein
MELSDNHQLIEAIPEGLSQIAVNHGLVGLSFTTLLSF